MLEAGFLAGLEPPEAAASSDATGHVQGGAGQKEAQAAPMVIAILPCVLMEMVKEVHCGPHFPRTVPLGNAGSFSGPSWNFCAKPACHFSHRPQWSWCSVLRLVWALEGLKPPFCDGHVADGMERAGIALSGLRRLTAQEAPWEGQVTSWPHGSRRTRRTPGHCSPVDISCCTDSPPRQHLLFCVMGSSRSTCSLSRAARLGFGHRPLLLWGLRCSRGVACRWAALGTY